jgi:5'-3' exonuclease
VDEIGYISLTEKKKLIGTGLRFFYSQLLTGDTVDNIPGLPGCGPVAAHKALAHIDDEIVMFDVVRGMYLSKGFDDDYLLEQGQLLWMTRERDEKGGPKLWQFPS